MNDRTPRTSDNPDARFHDEPLEPAHDSMTAAIAEQAALYGATPGPGERDTRDVWLDEGAPLSPDGTTPPHLARAFQNVAEGICLIVDTVAPDGYQMASERENLMWGLVNVFHAQMSRVETRTATLAREIESFKAAQDGSDSASLELEDKIHDLQSQSRKRDVFETFRDYAGEAYFHDAGKAWEPRTGSHVSQTGDIAPRIDSREFLRAREEARNRPEIPDGTVIAVTGGKEGPDWRTVFDTLDRVQQKYPDIALVHGGAPGMQQLAAKWADIRGVAQVPFLPDYDAHGKAAIARRDEEILKTRPTGVVVFAEPGAKPPRMHDAAIERGIPVMPVVGRAEPRQSPAPTPAAADNQTPRPAPDPLRREEKYAQAMLQPSHGFADPALDESSAHAQSLDDASRAYGDLVDSVLPEDNSQSAERQGLMWGIVNAVSAQISRRGGIADKAQSLADELKDLDRAQDGTEVKANQLAEKTHQLADTNSNLLLFENLRARLADTYKQQTGQQWLPRPAAAAREARPVTAAGAEATNLIEDLEARRNQAHLPEGTPIALTGWKEGPDRQTIFETLDKVREKHPDMYLMHGNAPGTQKIAAEWAKDNSVAQVVFAPNRKIHGTAAVIRRDKAILDAEPVGVVDLSPDNRPTFLADLAAKRNIPVLNVSETAQGASQSAAREHPVRQNASQTQTQARGRSMSL